MANSDLNSASGGNESILDKLWAFGQSTIDRGLTYVLEKEQMERMIKLRQAEAQADLAKKESYTNLGGALEQFNTATGTNMIPYLAAGLFGLGAFVLIKKK